MHAAVKRGIGILAALVSALMAMRLATAGSALADHRACVTDPVSGTVSCWVVHDPTPLKGSSGGNQGGCTARGKAIPCSIPGDGTWDAAHQCYASIMNPSPPLGDPLWRGHTTGVIMRCTGGQGSGFFWSPNQKAAPPSAIVLAQRAASTLRLRTMSASSNGGTGPDATTYVGIPTWLWLPYNQWHSVSSPPATVAGESVTATASPASVVWSMGDGHSTSCAGPGSPYSLSDPSNPPCGYTYRVDSSKQPQHGTSVNDRYFTVQGTVTWTVSWTCTGPACDQTGGALPALTRTTPAMPLRVFQVETVVTGGH